MWIKAIYKLPQIKHAFFIVAPLEEQSTTEVQLSGNKRKREYFEQILRCKDHSSPTETQQWTLKIVSESDFVKVLKQHMPKGLELSNPSSHSPELLELLAINLLKTPDFTNVYQEQKVLSVVPEEDIIEVFI